MAVLTGRNADVYIATATGTAMTGEAVTSLGSGRYQITSTTKRAINPNSALTVKDGASTIPAQYYQVSYGAGIVTITNGYTVGGTVTITGEYLTLSAAGQAYDWTLNTEVILEETQTFGTAWKSMTQVMKASTATFKRFYNDGYFRTNIGSYYVLALYADTTVGARYVCGAMVSSQGISAAENETVKEDVSFIAHGEVAYIAS